MVKEDKSQKKAKAFNDDLTKAGAFNKGDHKSVTAWLNIRNNAVRGKFEEYQIEQVELMFQGVEDFISRYPV